MTTKVSSNELSNTGVTAGTYGGTTQHSVITTDAQGRIISAANATPSIATSQLTGTFPTTSLSGTITGAQLASGAANTNLGFTPYNSTNPAGYITSSGTAAAISGTIPTSQLTGTIPTSQGGTGLTSSGGSGGVLISDGSTWTTSVITGKVSYFAMSTAPTGWIKANGAAISRTTYDTLFAAIGTYYGAGDGSTTFNIPDLRGEFLRGWDDGRGLDSGRSFGTVQGQDWKTLYLQDAGQASSSNYTHDVIGIKGLSKIGVNDGTLNLFMGNWANPSAHLNGYWGGEEIRPRNVSLLACIKF